MCGFSNLLLKAPNLQNPLILFVITLSHCLCRNLCVGISHTERLRVHMAYFPEAPAWVNIASDICVPVAVLCFIINVLIALNKCLCHFLSLNHLPLSVLSFFACLVYASRCLFFAFCSNHCHPLPVAQESGWAGRITCRVTVCPFHTQDPRT
jgi:hypothetical protein